MPTLKYSRQRESIKDNLMHRTDHPTADMVYSDIRKVYPNISLGTVYRNLALLSDLGEIQKLTTSDGAVRFDGNTAPHNHFTCRKCGSVLDLEYFHWFFFIIKIGLIVFGGCLCYDRNRN